MTESLYDPSFSPHLSPIWHVSPTINYSWLPDGSVQETEWYGRFQDQDFGGFESEVQALRWVLRRMGEAYTVAVKQIRERNEKEAASAMMKHLADFQAREIAGDRCALCGREYGDDIRMEGPIYFQHEGRDEKLPRSVHAECYHNFTREFDGLDLGFTWQDLRQRWQAAKPGVWKPGDRENVPLESDGGAS